MHGKRKLASRKNKSTRSWKKKCKLNLLTLHQSAEPATFAWHDSLKRLSEASIIESIPSPSKALTISSSRREPKNMVIY